MLSSKTITVSFTAILFGLAITSCEAESDLGGYVAPLGTPEIAAFGSSVEQLSVQLDEQCFEVSAPTSGSTRLSQEQEQVSISCHLIEYYGGERNAEFVFLSNKLVYVSFDLDFEDLPYRVDEKIDQLGKADINDDERALFIEGGVLVDKTKPAAIYFSRDISDLISSSF